ncbi:Uncharacterised protein [Mycobacterium tuberculosis]|nr:Uncharacterised protein [Mycobacterium tuberculosis]
MLRLVSSQAIARARTRSARGLSATPKMTSATMSSAIGPARSRKRTSSPIGQVASAFRSRVPWPARRTSAPFRGRAGWRSAGRRGAFHADQRVLAEDRVVSRSIAGVS